MNGYTSECIAAGIPYLYDPSMQLPRLERADLEKGCRGARILAGNDYEFGMMAEKLGISESDLRRLAPVTVMTRGEAGALITAGKEEFDIPPAKPKEVLDPTGAGDAFRAGFILGVKQGLPWPVVGRLAWLSGVYAIEHKGPQQHSYTRAIRGPLPRKLRGGSRATVVNVMEGARPAVAPRRSCPNPSGSLSRSPSPSRWSESSLRYKPSWRPRCRVAGGHRPCRFI